MNLADEQKKMKNKRKKVNPLIALLLYDIDAEEVNRDWLTPREAAVIYWERQKKNRRTNNK